MPGSVVPAGLPTGSAFRSPPVLVDQDAQAGLFTASLTAAAASVQFATRGAATVVWAFNGSCPGPLIDVREGDTVRIVFNNRLSQASTIHWHGLPVPADQDGNPMDPVAPGASKAYTFTLPAGSAGTYWYHPHAHETTAEQVFRGLAGCLIVRPAADPLAGITERVMMVTDLRLDTANQIAPDTAQDRMFGREGDHLLVNGLKMPVLAIQPGATERWRVVNATNARYLRLALGGHNLRVISHGAGLIEQPQSVVETLLAPAQRVDFLVQATSQPNQSFDLVARAYSRGMMMSSSVDTSLLVVRTSLAGTAPAASIPALFAPVAVMAPLVRTQNVVLSDSMAMGGGMGMVGTGMGGMGMGSGTSMGMTGQFLINGRAFDPARTDLVMRVGITEDWLVTNQGGMDHPFHVHGTQFQLVGSSRGDTTPGLGYRAWIDTINIRSGETVRLRMCQTQPGKRMFHCHILEHEDQGMMAVLDVQA